MKFKTMQLIVDNDCPTSKDLQKIVDNGKHYVKEYYSDCYKIESKMIDDRYLWIYVEYENAKPYNDTIYDGKDDEERQNPRRKTEVELRKQFFTCYDLGTKRLYTTKHDKKGFLEYYFSDTLQKDIIIKNIYSSLDEFENSIKTLESIKFTQVNNLYTISGENSMFKREADILGFGLPEKLKMQIDYGKNLTGEIKNSLRCLQKRYRSDEFEHIVIVGKDENNIEKAFDFSTRLESVEIQAMKDENGRYDNNDVLFLFKDALRNKDGKKA